MRRNLSARNCLAKALVSGGVANWMLVVGQVGRRSCKWLAHGPSDISSLTSRTKALYHGVLLRWSSTLSYAAIVSLFI